jgi:acyl carrier protein
MKMNDIDRIRKILRETLQLGSRADELREDTRLLGGIPEFDSMAVVGVITSLEEEFGITIDDDELSASVFETVGSLSRFVASKACH